MRYSFVLASLMFLNTQSTLVYAENVQLEESSEQITKQPKDESLHYGIHIVTDGCARLFFVASLITGGKVGKIIDEPLPILASAMAGLWVIYKTPQWTDKYVLEKSDHRTTKQNIITFLSRI